MTPTIKLFRLLHECNIATVMNCNLSIWCDHRGVMAHRLRSTALAGCFLLYDPLSPPSPIPQPLGCTLRVLFCSLVPATYQTSQFEVRDLALEKNKIIWFCGGLEQEAGVSGERWASRWSGTLLLQSHTLTAVEPCLPFLERGRSAEWCESARIFSPTRMLGLQEWEPCLCSCIGCLGNKEGSWLGSCYTLGQVLLQVHGPWT